MAVRLVTGSLSAALSDTVSALDLEAQDDAVVALALAYAEAIDEQSGDPDALNSLGPKLLSTLVELKATPKSRTVKSAAPVSKVKTPLELMREARSS
jgi:hypothetical protein